MNARKITWIVALAAALPTMALAGVQPPARAAQRSAAPQSSATQPAGAGAELAQRLAPFLKVIRQADDARTVMRTYTRALAVDRDSVELHRSYMRRMLAFGLPQIAQHAARELLRLEKADGMAHGLLGYMDGRRGALVGALVATVRAAERTPDDPSVLNNLGQLVAWHDLEEDPPPVPDAARRALARLRPALAKKPPFAAAYKRLQSAYTQQGAVAKALAAKMAAAEAEATAVQALARDVNNQLQELNDEIDYRNRMIDRLWREAYSGYVYWNPYKYHYGYYGHYVLPPYYSRSYHREELYDRIAEQEREIEKFRVKLKRVRREGQAVLGELARKEAALKALRDQVRQAMAKVARQFRWDPPPVDGVVAAEREHLPPAPAKPKMAVPTDPETESAQSVELAKLYLRHNMSEKAIGLLQMVVRKFEDAAAHVSRRRPTIPNPPTRSFS